MLADEALAKEGGLLLGYRAAIRAALADVETCLAQLHHLDEQRDAEKVGVRESRPAFEAWGARHHGGAVQYAAVLEAPRTLIAAGGRLAQDRLARLQSLTGLKALGGSWDRAAAEALTAASTP